MHLELKSLSLDKTIEDCPLSLCTFDDFKASDAIISIKYFGNKP